MELYIDDRKVDTDAGSGVSISLSVAKSTDPRTARAGYTRALRVPMSAANDALFGYAAEIHARDGFNAEWHTGRVEHEGAVLIEGPLYLGRVQRAGSDPEAEAGFYEVHIIGAAKEWVGSTATRPLRHTTVPWSGVLTGSAIAASWTGEGPVRFLPVARARTEPDHSSGGVIPAVKVLTSDDYHPFINARALLYAIFAESGFAVESDFVDGEFFRSLHISGNYPSKDTSILKSNMDFLARRLAPSSAVANSQGRVYADPYRTSYTVGNIVDDPGRMSADSSADDVFTKNGCFRMDDDRVEFVPTSAVSVGFRFHLRYTTDYRIRSRTALTGFDQVYLGEQSARSFTLANPYPDRREAFRAARTYKVAVFDHVAGRQYQLRYSRQTSTGGSGTVSSPVLVQRFSDVAVEGAISVGSPVLYYRSSAAGAWLSYTGDWALYDGFVGETGTIDVELTLRTAPESVSPGQPKFFDTIYFGGAEPGMRLTVSDRTWVRPVFYAQPTEGTTVSFADVCAHDVTQMDFIDSMRQMFNLRFHTDNRSRKVRIEPAGEFYSGGEPVDLTDRVDLGKPIVVEELGGDLSRRMEWCYRTGDEAVERFNRSASSPMGYWRVVPESFAAADRIAVWENRMFTPSLNASGVYLGAPSALLVQVAYGSADLLEGTEDLNFTPRVVRYEGMKPLPAGERWGWPLSGGSYPKLAFHAPESGYTLCFENRDGCTGLHSRYDADVRLWNYSRRVTLWLALSAADVCSLSFPTGYGVDFRKLVRISIDGEQALYRLEEVCDYRPGAPSTKCILVKHIP